MADFCAVRDRGFNGRKIIDEGVNNALKMPRSMRFMRHHCHLIRHAELVCAMHAFGSSILLFQRRQLRP
jgi:hypothetical protein